MTFNFPRATTKTGRRMRRSECLVSNGEIRIEMHYSVALLLLFERARAHTHTHTQNGFRQGVYRVVWKVLHPFGNKLSFWIRGKNRGKSGWRGKCLHSDVEIASTICDECCLRMLVTRGWNRCHSSNRPAKGRNLEWEDFPWKTLVGKLSCRWTSRQKLNGCEIAHHSIKVRYSKNLITIHLSLMN